MFKNPRLAAFLGERNNIYGLQALSTGTKQNSQEPFRHHQPTQGSKDRARSLDVQVGYGRGRVKLSTCAGCPGPCLAHNVYTKTEMANGRRCGLRSPSWSGNQAQVAPSAGVLRQHQYTMPRICALLRHHHRQQCSHPLRQYLCPDKRPLRAHQLGRDGHNLMDL